MPEMRFVIRWPDGEEMRCYSPSHVVGEMLPIGPYTVEDLVVRARAALHAASDRVQERYGFPCSAAKGQLLAIEKRALAFDGAAEATLVAHEPPAKPAPAPQEAGTLQPGDQA